jgi:hypothetical protein
MKNIEEEIWSSRDINLATALIVSGIKLIGIDFQIEGEEGKKVGYFTFDKTPELIKIEQKYWDKTLLLEPREFSSVLGSLKSRVMNRYKNPNYKR